MFVHDKTPGRYVAALHRECKRFIPGLQCSNVCYVLFVLKTVAFLFRTKNVHMGTYVCYVLLVLLIVPYPFRAINVHTGSRYELGRILAIFITRLLIERIIHNIRNTWLVYILLLLQPPFDYNYMGKGGRSRSSTTSTSAPFWL